MIDGAVTGHVWCDDGHDDEGVAVQRCERCAVRSHWPAADWRCELYPRHGEPLSVDGEPLHDDQWASPFVPVVPRRCAQCARLYRVPVRPTATVCCSALCSHRRKVQRDRLRRNGVLA